MPILKTAKKHFDDDIARARELLELASDQSIVRLQASGRLRDDVLRASLMMAVGACDAYFCDAYADLISRTLRAKEIQSSVRIPDRLNKLKIPVIAVLRQSKGGWRWRMASRELIEHESVLSLNKIRELFNIFFDETKKLFTRNTIQSLVTHREARSRMFGISAYKYRKSTDRKKRDNALEHIEKHFREIFQRRHDCIHNCDRPKLQLQPIRESSVKKAIEDILFLVNRCHEAFLHNFPLYLKYLKFNGVTVNRVCA